MNSCGRVRPVLTAVAVAVLSAGGLALVGGHGASAASVAQQARPRPASDAVVSTGANRRAAVSDARARLRSVVAPAGAVPGAGGARTGAHAPLLTSETASAVAYRSWTVPESPQAVLAFVEAHLPPGSKLVSTGSGGPAFSESVIRSWPPVSGVLRLRWLELRVTALGRGGTRLYAESQSQWVVVRPRDARIPAGVRQIDIGEQLPGKARFLSDHVTGRHDVRALVRLFNSLGIVQPGTISCPAETVRPIVSLAFLTGPTGPAIARATVSSTAVYRWSPTLPGAACFPIGLTVRGRSGVPALVGNVITPIDRLLHLQLAR